jgi:flagellar motor protein MotB
VPFIDSTSRVGRTQGASIFWGLVSVFFAAAACFYFWKSHESDGRATQYHDQLLKLQEDNDALVTEKEKLQANLSSTTNQQKIREEVLDEKESKLAAEESRLDALAQKTSSATSAAASTATPKKFTDVVHRLSQNDGADSVTRAGRPVLRLPNTTFFAAGDATLKPDGQTLLNQIVQSLGTQNENFELRIETFSEDSEIPAPADATTKPADKPVKKDKDKDSTAKPTPDDTAAKPHFTNAWELTAARAIAIEHYLRDQGTMPFPNVIVVARGDSQPIVTTGKDHTRNRRTEIGITPVPSAAKSTGTPADSSTNSLTPPADSTPAAKDKDSKDKDGKDKDAGVKPKST